MASSVFVVHPDDPLGLCFRLRDDYPALRREALREVQRRERRENVPQEWRTTDAHLKADAMLAGDGTHDATGIEYANAYGTPTHPTLYCATRVTRSNFAGIVDPRKEIVSDVLFQYAGALEDPCPGFEGSYVSCMSAQEWLMYCRFTRTLVPDNVRLPCLLEVEDRDDVLLSVHPDPFAQLMRLSDCKTTASLVGRSIMLGRVLFGDAAAPARWLQRNDRHDVQPAAQNMSSLLQHSVCVSPMFAEWKWAPNPRWHKESVRVQFLAEALTYQVLHHHQARAALLAHLDSIQRGRVQYNHKLRHAVTVKDIAASGKLYKFVSDAVNNAADVIDMHPDFPAVRKIIPPDAAGMSGSMQLDPSKDNIAKLYPRALQLVAWRVVPPPGRPVSPCSSAVLQTAVQFFNRTWSPTDVSNAGMLVLLQDADDVALVDNQTAEALSAHRTLAAVWSMQPHVPARVLVCPAGHGREEKWLRCWNVCRMEALLQDRLHDDTVFWTREPAEVAVPSKPTRRPRAAVSPELHDLTGVGDDSDTKSDAAPRSRSAGTEASKAAGDPAAYTPRQADGTSSYTPAPRAQQKTKKSRRSTVSPGAPDAGALNPMLVSTLRLCGVAAMPAMPVNTVELVFAKESAADALPSNSGVEGDTIVARPRNSPLPAIPVLDVALIRDEENFSHSTFESWARKLTDVHNRAFPHLAVTLVSALAPGVVLPEPQDEFIAVVLVPVQMPAPARGRSRRAVVPTTVPSVLVVQRDSGLKVSWAVWLGPCSDVPAPIVNWLIARNIQAVYTSSGDCMCTPPDMRVHSDSVQRDRARWEDSAPMQAGLVNLRSFLAQLVHQDGLLDEGAWGSLIEQQLTATPLEQQTVELWTGLWLALVRCVEEGAVGGASATIAYSQFHTGEGIQIFALVNRSSCCIGNTGADAVDKTEPVYPDLAHNTDTGAREFVQWDAARRVIDRTGPVILSDANTVQEVYKMLSRRSVERPTCALLLMRLRWLYRGLLRYPSAPWVAPLSDNTSWPDFLAQQQGLHQHACVWLVPYWINTLGGHFVVFAVVREAPTALRVVVLDSATPTAAAVKRYTETFRAHLQTHVQNCEDVYLSVADVAQQAADECSIAATFFVEQTLEAYARLAGHPATLDEVMAVVAPRGATKIDLTSSAVLTKLLPRRADNARRDLLERAVLSSVWLQVMFNTVPVDDQT